MLNKYWNSYIQWYIKYSGFSERDNKEGLPYFRDKLFISILLLTFVLGVLSYFPSAYVAVSRNEISVLVVDTIAILVLLFTTFSKAISFRTRKLLFSTNLFLLSFLLFLILGFKGNGSILLFMLITLITLYSGKRGGLKAILVFAGFNAVFLFNFYFNIVYLPSFEQYDVQLLLIVMVNNLLFVVLTVFSVSFLINQLHNALLKENNLQLELVEKHEKVLEAKNKAEKSDKLKSAFLANMSHEIRTPMYGILGCADFLKAYNTEDEEFQEFVNVIDGNGKQLLDIISSIVDVSKIESGLITTNISTFNVNRNIEKVFKALIPKAEAKGLSFTLNNELVVHDAYINSDSGKIEFILKSLLENAIKFTEKGIIEFSCERIDEYFIAFYIKDTGLGIDEAHFKTVFDAFYQVDVNNDKALHGFGIGLTIAKAYIEMLGGEIDIESVEGIGSTFWFTIRVDLIKSHVK